VIQLEVKFEKTGLDCLQTVVCEVKNVEQTQELRLNDGMPDVGKVLCCWGQVLLRSKEWRGNGMSATGGVMVWVLYQPEDGSGPKTLETWVPFQVKWDFPETDRDGLMNVDLLLRCADARSLSARKLMIRVGISALGQGMLPGRVEFSGVQTVPKDVQLLRRSYPVRLPREAGEKAFELEEELTVTPVETLLRCELRPEIIDRKIMAGKVVFRGAAALRLLYMDADGKVRTWTAEVPFSQFADLEGEYDDTAQPSVTPAVTNLELERLEDGALRMKAGLTGQYVVWDSPVIQTVEDAYSSNRGVEVHTQSLELPMMLDRRQENLRPEQRTDHGGQVVDVFMMTEHPQQQRRGEDVVMELPVTFQLLVDDGELRCETVKTRETWALPVHESCRLWASSMPTGWPGDKGGSVGGDVTVTASTVAGEGLPMVTGLTLGETMPADPERPSLILRRSDGENLWELAKEYGSTVDAIRQSNGLTDEPQTGAMLLIPVL
jgi:hypothetical protein